MIIDPTKFENFGRVLTGVIVPRPIAFVSTVSSDGVVNLAPFSFFNAVSSSPPTVVIGISRSADWKEKDTLANIEATGEFVVNVVVDDIAEPMNATAAEYPADVDEFEIAGLTQTKSTLIKPPRVAETPGARAGARSTAGSSRCRCRSISRCRWRATSTSGIGT